MMFLRNAGPVRGLRPDTQRVRLLIVESGAASPESSLSREDFDEVILLRQFEGETPIDLFVRTCARISSLEFAGKRVGQAVLALAPSLDPLLAETRRLLGLTILSHVYAVGANSELVLRLEQNALGSLRQEVMALIESLVAHPGSRLAPIRVRFATTRDLEQTSPSESGTHPYPAFLDR